MQFFAPNLSVLFLTLFPSANRNSKFAKMEKKNSPLALTETQKLRAGGQCLKKENIF